MRRVRYIVATSLDGYIAGPNGEADWIVTDPAVDFGALLRQFDTLLVGRHTFESMARAGRTTMPGMKTIVFSRTLQQKDHPKFGIVAEGAAEIVGALRAAAGKDIWLFGGATLFRSLLDAGLVDTVELAVMPVLLGGGISLLPPPAPRVTLQLTNHRVYPSGIVSLEYAIHQAPGPGTGNVNGKR